MANCPVHGRPLQVVCGVEVCGLCYEAAMLAEPVHDTKPLPELIEVYSPSAHRMITVKEPSTLTATLAKV